MERKDFIKSACMLCGIAVIPSVVLDSCKKKDYAGPTNVNFTIDLTQSANTTLNTVGGYLITHGLIVIRVDTATFDALSATCTHQGCTVGYNTGSQHIVCPCHGGTYDLTGKVISGPPPKALSTYKTSLNGDILTVTS